MPSFAENVAALPRHPTKDALLASAIDPHPRKTRRIEWIGERSPFDDDALAAAVLLGRFTPIQQKAIRLAAARAVTRVDGVRTRMLEAGSDRHSIAPESQLSRTYVWNKANGYVQEVDYRDVDIILGGPSGHEFVDITDREPDEPAALAQPSPDVFKLVAQEVYGRADARLTIGQVVASR